MLSEVSSNSTKINRLMNIRSKYILKQILDNLQIHITLNIIRYNKNLQNKLNINLIDYIKNSDIELELYVLPNSEEKFINKNDKTITIEYLDNNVYQEEIKNNEITKYYKIKIKIYFRVKTLDRLFKGCGAIVKVKFIKLFTRKIEDMSFMFSECSSLKEIDILN